MVFASSLGFDDAYVDFIQASAQPLDGFTVRWDYLPAVKNYLREEVIFWNLLRKEQAEADPVQELLEGPAPNASFVDKIELAYPVNPRDLPAHDYTSPPQAIKAAGGIVQFGHYAQSLYNQQGRPWGDIVARRTERLIIKLCKILEKTCFTGNARTNPLEFNGIDSQMNPANIKVADATLGDRVVDKLLGIVALAMDDEDIMKNITHIFTNGLGCRLIERELDQKLEYHNLDEIRPGLKVPGIISHAGFLPIIPSPYINNIRGTGQDKDIVRFYLLDMNAISWKGVYPKGGQKVFDPQIFELAAGSNPTGLDKRIALLYGTLFVGNKGANLYRLDMKVAQGTVGSVV